MVTWILFALLLLVAFFAARYAFRKARRGECVGCSGCKGGEGCHCGHSSAAHSGRTLK